MTTDLWLFILGCVTLAMGTCGFGVGYIAGYDSGWDDADRETDDSPGEPVMTEDVFVMSPELARWVTPQPTRLTRPDTGETDTAWMRRITDDFIAKIQETGADEKDNQADT